MFNPARPGMLAVGTRAFTVRGYQLAGDLRSLGPEDFKLDCVQEVKALYGDDFLVRGASFSQDGHGFAASSYRGHVCVWEGSKGHWSLTAALGFTPFPDGNRRPAVRALAFSPSMQMLAAGDDRRGVHIWSKSRNETGWLPSPQSTEFTSKITDVSWSPDERYLAAVTDSGKTAIFQVFANGSHSDLTLLEPSHNGRVESGKFFPVLNPPPPPPLSTAI